MEESVSSFYRGGLGTRTQVISHNDKSSYLLNHLASPICPFLMSSSKPQDLSRPHGESDGDSALKLDPKNHILVAY